MLNIVAINQGAKPLTMQAPRPVPLDARAAGAALDRGAVALDIRAPADFGASHLPEALHVPASSSEFEQRAGWMLPPEGEIFLVAEDERAAQEAAFKLAFVGLDGRVSGFVTMHDWRAGGLAVSTLPQLSVEELWERRKSEGIGVLDVREPSEWREGHLEEASLMSYRQLPARLAELGWSPDEPVAVICATGMRSSTASSVLLRAGFRKVFNVTGGMRAWKQAGFPLTSTPGGR
ncbi:MAG TPA: rhodanese-like domain-containing protein [Candidatus Polarisedimenticolia bacterium]|nr:rhodanese-like domain-containing protein [Candidatus Polarisedimenticolia bacterium]